MNFARTLWLGTLALIVTLANGARADVTVTQTGSTLKLKSDNAPDIMNLTGADSGQISIFVNNVSQGSFDGVHDVQVTGGGGDDLLTVDGIQIGGSLKVKMNEGIDKVFVRSDGNAQRELLIGGSIDLSLGGQSGDEVFIANDNKFGVTIGRNLVVRGASQVGVSGSGGNSNASEPRDVRVVGNVVIDSNGAGDASIALANTNIHGSTSIKTGASVDVIQFDACHCLGAVTIQARAGDDNVAFGINLSANKFESAFVLDGGPGHDTTNAVSAGVFAVAPKVKQVEILQ